MSRKQPPVKNGSGAMPGGALAPFRQPVFRAIWIATLASNFGSMIQSVGAAWLMTSISSSARTVSLVQASATVPIMLLALFAGAIADSYDRRLVMLGAQLLMLFASAALALMTFTGEIAPITLLLCTFLVGVGTSLNGPSWQASIRSQVPIADLPAAVALNSVNFNLARSLGPAIGGALMALFGPAANFTVNTLSYVALIAVLLRWQPAGEPPRREPLGRAIRAGLTFAMESPPIRNSLFRAATFGILTGAIWALMPLIARDLLHGDQSTYGIILGAFGVGSIGGALLASRARRSMSNEHVFALASLAFGIGAVGAAWTHSTAAVAGFLLLSGMSWVGALSTINIVVQMSAAPTVVGRCLALYHMCAFGGLALGSYAWGNVAEEFSLRAALLISGGLLMLSPLLGLSAPLPRVAFGGDEAA